MNNQIGQHGWSSPSHNNWQSGGAVGMQQMLQMSPGGSWSNRGKMNEALSKMNHIMFSRMLLFNL